MNSGLLWFDQSHTKPLADKVSAAARYYATKYGSRPNVAFVNPLMLPEEQQTLTVDGVQVRPSRWTAVNHFWLGVDEKLPAPTATSTPCTLSRDLIQADIARGLSFSLAGHKQIAAPSVPLLPAHTQTSTTLQGSDDYQKHQAHVFRIKAMLARQARDHQQKPPRDHVHPDGMVVRVHWFVGPDKVASPALPKVKPMAKSAAAPIPGLPTAPAPEPPTAGALSFPLDFHGATLVGASISVMHSANEQRLRVMLYLVGRLGKRQTNDYSIWATQRGEEIELYITGIAARARVPLADWQAFVDQIPVEVSNISKTTVSMSDALVTMARDVMARRRKAPTDAEWKAETETAGFIPADQPAPAPVVAEAPAPEPADEEPVQSLTPDQVKAMVAQAAARLHMPSTAERQQAQQSKLAEQVQLVKAMEAQRAAKPASTENRHEKDKGWRKGTTVGQVKHWIDVWTKDHGGLKPVRIETPLPVKNSKGKRPELETVKEIWGVPVVPTAGVKPGSFRLVAAPPVVEKPANKYEPARIVARPAVSTGL